MALYPAPSPNHADPTLQPSYFTSSLYTEALHQDLADLISRFHQQYTANPTDRPFSTFKHVWCSQGWHLLHFRVFDDRTRERFLSTTCRLFLDKSKKDEPLFTRITATLALYTFYSTQPLNTTPALWSLKCIPIPINQFRDFRALGEALTNVDFSPFQPTVSHILRFLRDTSMFVILPDSSLFPQNPRCLPRETYVDQGRIAYSEPSSAKKKGRPSTNDKMRKAKAGLNALETWLEKTEPPVEPWPTNLDMTATPTVSASSSVGPKANEYRLYKSQLLKVIDNDTESGGHSAVIKANQLVLERLREIRDLVPQDGDLLPGDEENSAGIGRVENAVEDLERGFNRGILDLLRGSGKR